jgi:hypothetical protein
MMIAGWRMCTFRPEDELSPQQKASRDQSESQEAFCSPQAHRPEAMMGRNCLRIVGVAVLVGVGVASLV